MRKGIVLDDNNDILIKETGMVIDQTDYQNVSVILNSNQGDIKQYPTLGASLEKDVKSTNKQAQISRKIQMQLQADGYSAEVNISGNKIQVEI